MPFRIILAAVAMMFAAPGFAQGLDVNLSEKTAQFMYSGSLGKQGFGGRASYEAGLLFNRDLNTNTVLVLGLQMVDEAGSGAPGLEAGLGIRAYGADGDNYQAMAIAIGGQVRYHMPSLKRLGFEGQIHYAPGVVTFVDGRNLLHVEARAGYEVLPDATLYVGYRDIRIGLDGMSDTSAAEGLYLGMRFSF